MKVLFSKYETLSLKKSSPISCKKLHKVLDPDEYVSLMMIYNRFIIYCSEYITKGTDTKFIEVLHYEKTMIKKPILQIYPLENYPEKYK